VKLYSIRSTASGMASALVVASDSIRYVSVRQIDSATDSANGASLTAPIRRQFAFYCSFIGCLHDRANIEQLA